MAKLHYKTAEVQSLTGLSQYRIKKLIEQDKFPKPDQFISSATHWYFKKSIIDQWLVEHVGT